MNRTDSLDQEHHGQRSYIYPVPRRASRRTNVVFDEPSLSETTDSSSGETSSARESSLTCSTAMTHSLNKDTISSPRNDFRSSFFIPGITGKPRCLELDETPFREQVSSESRCSPSSRRREPSHHLKHSSSSNPNISRVQTGIRVDRAHVDQERVKLLRLQCELDDVIQSVLSRHFPSDTKAMLSDDLKEVRTLLTKADSYRKRKQNSRIRSENPK